MCSWSELVRGALLLWLAMAVVPYGHAATDQLPPVPQLQGRVTDVAGLLSAAERERIASALADYERETTHQLVVLIVPGLSGERIESFSLRVANSWRLGQAGSDNGILVTLALKERRVRIELGLGFRNIIDDTTAAAIIEQSMVPAFRRNDYAAGIEAGLQRLMEEGRKLAVPRAGPR